MLWSAGNHIDKYLLSKYFKGGGVGALVIFSSLGALGFLPIIYFFQHNVFDISMFQRAVIILSGCIYVVDVFLYIKALEYGETSVVVPLFQLLPVFAYVLGFLVLGERIGSIQTLGAVLIIVGAITITIDLKTVGSWLNHRVLLLMTGASFLGAVNNLIFKIIAVETDFLTTSFWEYVGFVIFGTFLFIAVAPWRREFLTVLRVNKIGILSLNGLNEALNIIARFFMNYATLLVPLSMALVVNGFQPFFVFIYGIILTLFFPHIAKESLLKEHLAQKIIAITIIFIGSYFLNS